MTLLAFVVPGDPVPKERPRVGRYGGRTPPRTRAYEQSVRLHALAALGRLKRAGIAWPSGARYEVNLVVHRSTAHVLDVDNVGKAALDGMQGAAFANDAAVDVLTIARGSVDRENPRLVVTVRAMTPAQSAAVALAVEQCMGDE